MSLLPPIYAAGEGEPPPTVFLREGNMHGTTGTAPGYQTVHGAVRAISLLAVVEWIRRLLSA
jgi:hypothetical protein